MEHSGMEQLYDDNKALGKHLVVSVGTRAVAGVSEDMAILIGK